MVKKVPALVLAGAMTLSLAACGPKEAAPSASGSQKPAVSTSTSSPAPAGSTAEGLKEAFAESPILVTSGGQSADYQMIATVMGKLGMDYEVNNVATSADLGAAKTLIVVVGGSSKGLGAAGVDADGELARLDELMTAAEQAGVSIIVMHTGGDARRGDLSDKFIEPIFSRGDYAIVVAKGDEDGLMAGICAKNNIPVDKIDSISDVTTVLPAAFK